MHIWQKHPSNEALLILVSAAIRSHRWLISVLASEVKFGHLIKVVSA